MRHTTPLPWGWKFWVRGWVRWISVALYILSTGGAYRADDFECAGPISTGAAGGAGRENAGFASGKLVEGGRQHRLALCCWLLVQPICATRSQRAHCLKTARMLRPSYSTFRIDPTVIWFYFLCPYSSLTAGMISLAKVSSGVILYTSGMLKMTWEKPSAESALSWLMVLSTVSSPERCTLESAVFSTVS